MNERTKIRANLSSFTPLMLAFGLALPACGGAVQSGVALGKVAQTVENRAASAPQGAEVCGLRDALNAPPGSEKPASETCGKAAKSDDLWRKTMMVIGAYGETLASLSAGGGDNSGKIEAALTGVSGNDWATPDGPAEAAARDAATQLSNQLSTNAAGGDLGKAITNAAPHVKTICDGLVGYLETQAKSLGDIQKDTDKKRTQKQDRRCGSLDSRSICVGESVLDRMVYADVFAQASLLEHKHKEARDAVAGFCAAHKKLEAAAADGRLKSDETYQSVVDAVKSARQASPAPETKPAKK
jgi:hypothetical protein